MVWAAHIRAFLLALLLLGVAILGGAGPAAAQTAVTDDAPAFTVQSLRSDIEALDALTEGEAEIEPVLQQRRTSLVAALERMEDAARQREIAARYTGDFETGQRTLASLRQEVNALENIVGSREPMDSDAAPVGEAAMFATEQELLAKESELRALQAEMEAYRTQLAEIGARLTAAPRELSDARSQLGEVASMVIELEGSELDGAEEARRKALQAREYFHRQQVAALEAEIASLPVRQEVVVARRNLAALRSRVLTQDVLALQDVTGRRKLVEARQQVDQARAVTEALENAHPLAMEMAAENLRLAEVLTDLATGESATSRKLAAVRGQTANVQNDLTAATELVSLGQLDREAGATLRRLGNQLTPAVQLRASLRDTQRSLASLTRQRVVAQEQLRDLPVGAIDPQTLLQQAQQAEPALPALSEEDALAVRQLAEQRRAFLRQIANTVTGRINAVAELQTAQNDLVDKSQELRTVLDENLLWVPSVPAVDAMWPGKAIRGGAELFSFDHVTTAGGALLRQSQRLWPVLLIFTLLIALAYRLRPALWRDIVDRAERVGRVKQDSLWHTPAVIGAGLLMAVPWPLFFALLSILFGASNNPDLLISGLSDGFLYLSVFSMIIVTWKYWDRERSLFAAHFKLPKTLRNAVQSNLRWFLPVVGTTSFLLATTSGMRGENIYEGFSLGVFIVTALALATFFFRILWQSRESHSAPTAPALLSRYRLPLAIFAVGLPLFAAIMAGAGWYDSADDILLRIFETLWVLLFTYVIYGTVRRAITVAQRQIKYRQAVERREAQIKARLEQREAEARGEETSAPPPVDTEAIDVTAMSRQSAQLLKTVVVLGLVGMLWLIWSDLLPALTIFDGFEIGRISTSEMDDNNNPIERVITLWTVLQALVIAVITIIAARNLPGFLEIFILNRMGVDAGARYAVVTILGYIIVAIGIVMSFQRLGLQWGQLQWVVGGLSLGIGIGLQKIFANFVSGLIILFERPIRIGDFVTIGEMSGTVTRIKIRATTLGDLDNREILIPNENLISQEVTNWTLSNSTTRVIVYVGIAYGSDTDGAREVMMDVIRDNPKILETPAPQVFFLGFGDSSLDFQLRFFLRAFEDRFPVSHQIHTEVNKALASAGYEIPFPQRDLNIRTQDIPLDIRSSASQPFQKRSSDIASQIENPSQPPKSEAGRRSAGKGSTGKELPSKASGRKGSSASKAAGGASKAPAGKAK